MYSDVHKHQPMADDFFGDVLHCSNQTDVSLTSTLVLKTNVKSRGKVKKNIIIVYTPDYQYIFQNPTCSVQNLAAQVIMKTNRHDPISPILRDLHWLPIRKPTNYKMMVLAFNALNEQGPSYIADFFKLYKPRRSFRSEGNIISPCAWSQYLNKQTVIELHSVDHLELSPQILEDNKIVYFIFKTFENLFIQSLLIMLHCMTDLRGLLLSTILALLIETYREHIRTLD